MKKFFGAICSAVAGILTFVMLSLNWLTKEIGSLSQSYTGWDLISNSFKVDKHTVKDVFTDINGYVMTRIFAIAMLVLAILLIIMSVVLILKNVGVLKIKSNMSLINNILLVVFVVSIVLTIIGLFIMRADILDGAPDAVKVFVAVGAWLQLVVAVAACGCGLALARKNK